MKVIFVPLMRKYCLLYDRYGEYNHSAAVTDRLTGRTLWFATRLEALIHAARMMEGKAA
jgi:hypothetical protein